MAEARAAVQRALGPGALAFCKRPRDSLRPLATRTTNRQAPMPFDIREDHALNVLLVKWRGRFSADEVADYHARLPALELFQAGAPNFHDARELALGVPSSEIRRVAMLPVMPTRAGGTRRVALLAGDALGYGMLRALAIQRERPPLAIDVFRDVGAAKRWLGLPEDGRDPFEGMG